jgi:hypothetical protein
MRFVRYPRAVVAACLFVASGFAAQAKDHAAENAPVFRDTETKDVFGFTSGSGIGLQGEKAFEISNEANFGKADGRYWASTTKFEYEFTPSQYFQFEFGPFASYHSISNVTGRDDRNELAFGGLFGEVRYLLLERGPTSPWSVTLSAEPEWKRISGGSGDHVNAVELELKLNADVELIDNRLYGAVNLLYEPEATHDPDDTGAGWEMESDGGVSAALSYRITPSTFVGGEIWYLRHYEGAWFNTFEGDAVYIGPTVFTKLAHNVSLAATWNAQVYGSDVDDPGAHLNLGEFSRHRAKLSLEVEF